MDVRHSRRTAPAAVVVLLVVGTLVSSLASTASAGDITRRERMLQLTNDARVDHHRRRVALVDRLSHYAKRHSIAMAEAGYLFHSDSSVLGKVLAPYDWSIGGENVGVGESVDSLQAAFMASRVHRENILRSEFDHTAIGMVRRGGSLWVTVVFYG
jgi:uncharacterized protein YkwD